MKASMGVKLQDVCTTIVLRRDSDSDIMDSKIDRRERSKEMYNTENVTTLSTRHANHSAGISREQGKHRHQKTTCKDCQSKKVRQEALRTLELRCALMNRPYRAQSEAPHRIALTVELYCSQAAPFDGAPCTDDPADASSVVGARRLSISG